LELRSVDPRSLKPNPNDPRRIKASPEEDKMLTASIAAIGIIQPPVVRALEDGALQITFGSRRVRCAIAAKKDEIPVLVLTEHEEAGEDSMRGFIENVARANMSPVDVWRHVETLENQGWTENAIAAMLAYPINAIRRLRLLGRIHPAMLDRMGKGDMPDDGDLRVIASATPEEQAAVWKTHKPGKGADVNWWQIAQALRKDRIPISIAKFDDELARAYSIVWTEDLFAEGGKDSRTTTQVEAFLGAQAEWLANNLPEKGVIVQPSQHGEPKLPAGAQRTYGAIKKGHASAWWIVPRTGEVQSCGFLPASTAKKANSASAGAGTASATATSVARAPITQKGLGLTGAYRTDALHQAIRQNPIDDTQLIGLLVLAFTGLNVHVDSTSFGQSARREIAGKITEGGALTRDAALLRATARDVLTAVLSLQQDRTNSGASALYAGFAIGADAYLPQMATAEFLTCLSKDAINRAATSVGVLPRERAKDTRAAVIAHFKDGGTFVFPSAQFTAGIAEAQALDAGRKPGEIDANAANDGAESSAQTPNGPADDLNDPEPPEAEYGEAA